MNLASNMVLFDTRSRVAGAVVAIAVVVFVFVFVVPTCWLYISIELSSVRELSIDSILAIVHLALLLLLDDQFFLVMSY